MEKNKSYIRFYLLSLIAVLLASVYPIYMGVATMISYLKDGMVRVEDYQKYIIPYTPICIAVIVTVALMPLIFKLCKKYTLIASSILAAHVFFIAERFFEQIKVFAGYITMPLESWQYSLCIQLPPVRKAIGEPLFAANHPEYKIHFYIIALVMILAVINVVYGFSKMIREKDYTKRPAVIAQLISALVFIGLCILACFTAFYRTGAIEVSAVSALLMTAFFIVFGVTFGVYFGCIFYGKRKGISVIVPATVASMTTYIMYVGELILMGGVLFRLGTGFMFQPIGAMPFSAADILVILLSGGITYLIMHMLNRRKKAQS